MNFFVNKLIFVLLICLSSLQASYAGGLKSLVPSNINGPVSKDEIRLFNEYYKSFVIPENNDDKKMSWELSQFIHALLFMYEATKDSQYLDYAIVCADQIIKAKRTDDIDYVTKKTIPGWGYFNSQFKSANGPVLYNNVVGNATVMRALTRVAFLIQKNNLGEPYQDKAKTYIYSSIETINFFLGMPEWFNSKKNIFHFPNNKRHDRVLKGLRGIAIAHNRQLLMGSAILYVLQYYDASGKKFPYEKEYGGVIDGVTNYFWSNVKAKKKKGEVSYYTWYYRELGKNKKKPKIEDIGHGGYDVKALVHIYQGRNIGSPEQMKGLASTLMDRTLIDPENNRFAFRIDGSTFDKGDSDRKTQRDSMRWLALSEWDKRVYESAGTLLLKNIKLSGPLPYAEFLYFKAKFHGIEEELVN